VPRSDLFVAYVERIRSRPAVVRAAAKDAALLAARAAAADARAAAGGAARAAAAESAAPPRSPAGRFLGLRTAKYRAPDLARAKAWYSEVLGQPPYFDEPFYVGFDVGGFELGLDPDPADPGEGPGGVTVYWGVADADAAYGRLLALGAREHAALQDVGEGIRIGAVLDPFGNVFGVVQNPNFKMRSSEAGPS
jgi:predicted enzyme related to lactoylglutathione lyase